MDCSPPGSSVHEIFQARILEWVAISFSRGSSQPRDQTQVSCTAGRFFTDRATRKALITLDRLNNLLQFYISTCSFTLLFYVMEIAFFPLNFINYPLLSSTFYSAAFSALSIFIALKRVRTLLWTRLWLMGMLWLLWSIQSTKTFFTETQNSIRLFYLMFMHSLELQF